MEIPFVDLSSQNEFLQEKLNAAAIEVLANGQFILGPQTTAFESAIAAREKYAHGIAVGSGTDALLLSLMHLKVQPGDTVLVPNYTFSASANVIPRLGAIPVLVDVESPDGNSPYQMNPESMERMIDQCEVKPKVAIVVSLYGYTPNMKAIHAIAEQHNIQLIADWAQALGTEVDPQIFDLVCLSFYPTKNLGGFGDGGMILTNSEETKTNLHHLRNHGMTERYFCTKLGGNFRMNEMQAALLLVKLEQLDTYLEERKLIARIYDQLFDAYDNEEPALNLNEKLIRPPQNEKYTYNQYVVNFKTISQRKEVEATLTQAKIGCCRYYPHTIHQQTLFDKYAYEDTVSAHVAETSLALPIYPGLSEESIKQVVDLICLTLHTM